MKGLTMSEFNQKEYNSVILGALLHDVGKFLHRGNNKEYQCTHEKASFMFINKFKEKLQNDKHYDIDLLGILVRYHDTEITKPITLKEPFFQDKQKQEKEKIWKLISVIRRADSYSCAERDIKQPKRKGIDKRLAPLDSIFSVINLDLETTYEIKNCRYREKRLNPLANFPEQIEALNGDEMSKFILEFENNIPDFSAIKSFDKIISVWLNLLEKYLWAVPSDTRYESSDVSLYDHLRSSAAIAACLYKRHIVAIKQLKNMVKSDEFIFIGGDFSGIQNYIFDITNKGSGGASKRLRARSFFISLFSETTIHKILHALDLPLVCNIFSASGKFLLLAPNVKEITERLEIAKYEIEYEIHKTFFNQFSFLLSWEVIKGFRKQFEMKNFFKVADDMFHSRETEKYRKLRSIMLKGTDKWNEDAFKASELYNSYSGNVDCKICGKGPAIHKNPDNLVLESCDICYRDEVIGQELPKANYIAFGKSFTKSEEANKNRIILFQSENGDKSKKGSYFVELLRKYENSDEHYLVYRLNDTSDDYKTFIDKYYANHIPINKDQVLTFEDIAQKSLWEKENKTFGAELVGVLKADLDNLGLIFSKGLDKPREFEEECSIIQRKTISRFLTMSRMLELFFSGWIKEIMTGDYKGEIIKHLSKIKGIDQESFETYLKGDQINFKNIYTVYSGGDDLVLAGPWETMIIFSIYLNIQFRKYTCNNKFITLSAGLAFVKPKYPIASAIK
ncbi:MAG: type III-A CRISPR-associated protein Cas10/Csm1, partial [bacterium]